MEVEPLPQAINQSGTIVCGSGQLHIEVAEVPKKLSNQSGLCVNNILESGIERKQSWVETKFRPVKPQLWITMILCGVHHGHPVTKL